MAKEQSGPVCGIDNCRSRTYEEGEDGFTYCDRGHRQLGGLIRGADDEDNFTKAIRTITRKQKEVAEPERYSDKVQSYTLWEKDAKITTNELSCDIAFLGAKGFDLYIKCLQLILRRQLWFLVQDQGLPPELEMIVFDLWSLRIHQLADKFKVANSNSFSQSQSQSQTFHTLESNRSETEVVEKSLIAIKSLQLLSTTPKLDDCLSLCYIGMLILRLPITPGDIYAWIMDGKLPYRRAISHLPLEMRGQLPPQHRMSLDSKTLLKYKEFYMTVTSLQINFAKHHGISIPALNVPVLIFRYIRDLVLPLELYEMIKRLGELLDLPFALRYENDQNVGTRNRPEAQLAGCLVVCAKLLYPFDDEERHPKSTSEPTYLDFDWEEWCRKMITAKNERRNGVDKGLSIEELIKLGESDVLGMPPNQVDQYLDFYARTFLEADEHQRTKDKDGFRKDLNNWYPIDREDSQMPYQLSDKIPLEERFELVRDIHNGLRSVTVIHEGDSREPSILRPGQKYRTWKNTSDLSEQAQTFCEEVAKVGGFSLEMLVIAVSYIEGRIEQWRRKAARSQ